MSEHLQIRIQEGSGPTLIYLPGTHGDWTLNSGFRREIAGRVRFVEFTFPRTTEWSLDDHVTAIEQKLSENKIERGWILAESFASQVAWAWIGQRTRGIQVEGIILAGGFVRHPIMPNVRLAEFVTRHIPLFILKIILSLYCSYARARENNSPEIRASLREFVQRRTKEDLLAAAHRLHLIATNDLRPVARAAQVPIYCLSGFHDPVVPWPFVRSWLKKNCGQYRDCRIIFASDHHVLGAAKPAAKQILKWMSDADSIPCSNSLKKSELLDL